MPHFVIEYSRDVEQDHNIKQIMQIAHDSGAASGVMNPDDIKVRALAYDHYLLVGANDSFVHVTVYLLAGRSDEQKLKVSSLLREKLADYLPGVTSISIDVRDMNGEVYLKRLLPSG